MMEIDESEETYVPEDYKEYIDRIEKCKLSRDLQSLKETRAEFSSLYPLLPSIWLDWIDEEIENGTEREKIEELFERALKDFHSDKICSKLIEWATGHDLNFAKEKIEQVIQVIGLRTDAAHIAWESYLDIVEAEYAMLDEESRELKIATRDHLTSLFDRALRIPHSRLTEVYERYTEFIGAGNESEATKTAYLEAMKAYKAIEPFEENIANSDDKISAYAGYIAYELDGKNPARIQMIFERAVVEFPFSMDLWLQYTSWVDTSLKIPSLILSVYNRACQLCSGCSALWQQSLLALERTGMEYEQLAPVWEGAKAAIQSEDEAVAVYRTYIYLSHRHLVKVGSNDLSLVENLFKEALKFLKEEFGGRRELSIQLRKNFAYYLYSKSKKAKEAREIWKEIFGFGLGNTASAWLEAISLERCFGEIAQTRRWFYMAINSVTDKPYDVFGALVQFEREEGSLEELDKALEKVNAQAKRLSSRPQQPKERHPSQHPQDRKRAADSDGCSPKKKARNDENEGVFKKPNQPLKNLKAVAKALPVSENTTDGSSQQGPSKDTNSSTEGEGFKYSTGLEKNKLFVRNVDFACTEEEVKEFFTKYGQVKSVRIGKRKDGSPKGFAYVEYEDEQQAAAALKANDSKLHGRKIKVFLSNPPPKDEVKRMPNQNRESFKERLPQRSKFDEAQPTQHFARAGRLMIPRSISKATPKAENGEQQAENGGQKH